MSCRIVNETSFNIKEDILKKCVQETAASHSENRDISCSIVLVESDKIKDLNEKYYNKKGPTDVLTFASDEDGYAGDIIICPSHIKESTGDSGLEWELCHVVVHGTMHLLGIHHEDDGEDGHATQHDKEVQIINKILNSRNK